MHALGITPQNGRLPQPCPAFKGKLCGIYHQRPEPCRKFDCRLVQGVRAGRISVPEALRRIGAAKAVVRTVDESLRQLGQSDASMPLSHRFSNVMAEPLDLAAGGGKVRLRRRLAQAVDKLAERLGRDFIGGR